MFSETSVDFQRTTGHYVPEDRIFHNHRFKTLISYPVWRRGRRPPPGHPVTGGHKYGDVALQVGGVSNLRQ
jgi:hypothetical protein